MRVELDDTDLSHRHTAWQPRRSERLVGPANLGAVTHAGAVDWPLE